MTNTVKMLNPNKLTFENGKCVYVGEVFGDPRWHDGKKIRTGFITHDDEEDFTDSDGFTYEVIKERPVVAPASSHYNWDAYK